MSEWDFKPGDRVRIVVPHKRRGRVVVPPGKEGTVRTAPRIMRAFMGPHRPPLEVVIAWVEVDGFPRLAGPRVHIPCWRIQTKHLRKLDPPRELTSWDEFVRTTGVDPRKKLRMPHLRRRVQRKENV